MTAEAATSVDGQSIRYAIVGREDRVTPEALATLRANLQVLKDPQATGDALEMALTDTPVVLSGPPEPKNGDAGGWAAS